MKALEELKAAHAAATPGEWAEDGQGCIYGEVIEQGDCSASFVCDVVGNLSDGVNLQDRADAHLIALMHNALPALIECAEALSSLMDLHTVDDEGLPMSRWYLEETKESLIANARAALAKLEQTK